LALRHRSADASIDVALLLLSRLYRRDVQRLAFAKDLPRQF
jgi:hypothetical protein